MEEADLFQQDRRKLADRHVEDFSSRANAPRFAEPTSSQEPEANKPGSLIFD
jgi:hypothetical protein